MQFKDIIGQQAIKNHLINTARESRVSHAQLFLGPEGSGNLPLALAYAQYINCEQPSATDSCGECSSCRKYAKLVHPDLHFSYPFFSSSSSDTAVLFIEKWRKAFLSNPYLGLDAWRNELDAGNKQANINVAECHQIIQKLSLKAFEAPYKVLIMWLPEYLDKNGNTLLKLIEEPPEKTLFLLVAQNQDKLLNTIISRTQLVKVNAIDKQSLASYLVEEKHLMADKATQVAYISDGNLQRAIDLIAEGTNDYFYLFRDWLRACYNSKVLSVIDISESKLASLGRENQKSFLIYAINLMREVVLHKESAGQLVHVTEEELDFVSKFSATLNLDQLVASISLFERASYYIERNANPKILFLDVSLQLILLLNR
ncbi:ATP-binding protein [Olivibacter sitiensis]|uniref:DNA polymerase III subunit n=1 Tax=Olivibacter sitiensis TaxID=376470 RepID=UPI000420B986|nr:DNA polymerase III subunit gamma/tau [Olivibacter sitiensis]